VRRVAVTRVPRRPDAPIAARTDERDDDDRNVICERPCSDFLKLQRVARSTLANARETRFRFVYLGTPVLRRRIRVLTNRTAYPKLSKLSLS